MLSCQDLDTGGFGAAPGHDAHLLYTVSAVQILCLVDGVEELETRGRKGGKMAVGDCMFYHTNTWKWKADQDVEQT